MTDGLARYLRTANAVLRHVGGEHLLVPIRRGTLLDAETLYVLDDVGACVWEALATPRTLAGLASCVVEAFEVTPNDKVADDLRALLGDLVDQGLVEEASAG